MRRRYVELFNLGKRYEHGGGWHQVVRGFDLRIDEGELVALLGHSGCGKSTVLSMVAGLTPASEGNIVVGNREVSGPGPDRGVVFQAPSLLPWLTALENVRLGVDRVFARESRAAREARARRELELVGLGGALNLPPGQLSLGMQQRVGLARALALDPALLLLDEPFGMLDALTRMELQDVLLALLARQRKTALLVTHDVDEALLLADRIVLMTCGPDAHVGEVLAVPLPRPRLREQVLEHPDYYPLRARVLYFLDAQEAPRRDEEAAA